MIGQAGGECREWLRPAEVIALAERTAELCQPLRRLSVLDALGHDRDPQRRTKADDGLHDSSLDAASQDLRQNRIT